MLKFKMLVLLLILVVSTTATNGSPLLEQSKAKLIIMKTNRAIGVAHMTVKKTRKFTGKLSQSVAHARFAKKLYEKGDFDKSAQHSLYARKLATEVMKENNAKTGSDYLYSTDENAILSTSPTAEELANDVKMSDSISLDDEKLMVGNLDIEVK